MLVLSRKLREEIQIGENIVITILQVKGRSVRVGISAPEHVRIVRGELPLKPPTERTADDERKNRNRSRPDHAGESDSTDPVVTPERVPVDTNTQPPGRNSGMHAGSQDRERNTRVDTSVPLSGILTRRKRHRKAIALPR